ncbi:hypothetical protein [Streptomyces sp. AK08-02]|uniref:hypothetical protein n=1 Tax=Streptomyces sp. AK08-02 TaxID=3028654 RepID=UPI0029B0B72B|nr:hypothetical protein [Streptomyces sp. AK08-02]MDX3753705.1 hypothetical protein [Streptomyces sp. AK08-02]
MTLDETLDLLSQVALVDDRVVRVNETEQAAQLTMWAAILRDVPLDFAGRAIGEHYAESAWPVMPKDIAARWRTEARRRLDRHVGTFEPNAHPHLDPDNIPGYRAALRAEREGVRRGGYEPVAWPELMAGSDPIPAGCPNDEYRRAREAMRAAREAARVVPQESEATV